MNPGPDPIEALRDDDQWAWAAAELARRGDPGALPALVAAYDVPRERSRVPLLAAIEALADVETVDRLASSGHAVDRRVAARIAGLVGDPGNLATLERLAIDLDPEVASQARAALRFQVRDDAWRAVILRMAESSDESLRAAAAELLRL